MTHIIDIREERHKDVLQLLRRELPVLMRTILDILRIEDQLIHLPDDVTAIISHLVYLREQMFNVAVQRDPASYIRLQYLR